MEENNLKIQRAKTGLGLYTTKERTKGERITEYRGEHISSSEADKRGGKYLFTLNKSTVIDGKARDNIARYLNHSCRPNCYAEIDANEEHIFFYAKKKIAAGEELTFNYGKEYFKELIEPFGCKCEKCSEA